MNAVSFVSDRESWVSGLPSCRRLEGLFWTFKFRCILDIHVAILTQIWSSGNGQPGGINLSHLYTEWYIKPSDEMAPRQAWGWGCIPAPKVMKP